MLPHTLLPFYQAAEHDIDAYIQLLRRDGNITLVGAPPQPSSSNDTETIDNSSSSSSSDSGTDITSDEDLPEPPAPFSSSSDFSLPDDSSTSDGSTSSPDESDETSSPTPPPPATSEQPPSQSPSRIPKNEPPAANDQTIGIEEDASTAEVELLATDNNQDDLQTLKFTVVSDPKHGALGEIRQGEEASTSVTSQSTGGSGLQAAKAIITYTPDENYNGQDTFQFKVTDNSEADSNIATVTINIGPVNDAPIAQDDEATTDQDTPVAIDILSNDRDIDQVTNGDDTLTLYSIDQQSIQGGSIERVIISSDNDNHRTNNRRDTANEKIEYIPVEGFSGIDRFTYTIADINGATASATVTVIVEEGIPETQDQELPDNTSAEEEEDKIESEGESETEGNRVSGEDSG